jgi:hypothetical protein
MRRLYTAPKQVYDDHRHRFSTHMTTHWLALCKDSEPDTLAAWRAAGSPVVITTEFLSEGPQEHWESHPQVTVMPHPVWEGKHPLTHTRDMPENEGNTHDGLRHLTAAGHGVSEDDTIRQLHSKLAATHPAFRLKVLR